MPPFAVPLDGGRAWAEQRMRLIRSVGVGRIAAMLLLSGVLLLSACDKPKQREAEFLAQGKSLYESGDLVKASLQFKNAAQINPAGREAQYYLGLIAERQGDVGAAAGFFRKAAAADPSDFDANLKAGQYALMTNDPVTARTYANQLIKGAANKPEGHNLMAAALMLQGDVEAAAKEATTALNLDPKNVDSLILLAGKAARGGKSDEALSIIDRGLADKPESLELLLLKLKIMFDQGRSADVEAVLRQLVTVDPKNPAYVIDLANQLAQRDRFDEADAIFQKAIAANAGSDALVTAYAGFLANQKNVDEAISRIKTLIGTAQSQPRYQFLLEQLYLRAKRFDEATALMSELQQRSGAVLGDRLRAQVELARIDLLQGNAKKALEQLNSVLTEDPLNEGAFLLRSIIKLNDSDLDGAIADAKSVLHGDIKSADAYRILGKAYAASGDAELAISAYRNLLRLTPTEVDARLELAGLLANKSPQDAIDQIDAAIALRPDDARLKIGKAKFLIQTGAVDKGELLAQEMINHPEFSGVGHQIAGEAALARADYSLAVSELQKAASSGIPFADVGEPMVKAYMRAGKPAEAEKLLQDQLAKEDKDAAPLILLASIRMQGGKLAEAEELLQRAITMQPDRSTSYLELGRVLTVQRRFKEAVDVLSNAAAKFPNDPDIALFSAIADDTAGNFDAAKAGYERILAKAPAHPIAANNLAALIADFWPQDSKALDRARQLAERFRNTNSPMMLDTLGWVLFRQGNVDDAAIVLQKSISIDASNQQAQYHLAMALKTKGLAEKAREAFTKALAGTPEYRGLEEARKEAAILK
jgi:tetratricopeptide (TPR) repeat protein